jgi:hypothetical protein
MPSSPCDDVPSPFVRLSTVAERPLSWLCPGRLALGTLTLFDSDFGLGKSLVALDLAARLTTGRQFPDGSPGLPPSPVLIFPGDGGDADLVGRLRALDADLEQVYRPPRDGAADPLRLPGRTGALERALDQTHAKLVLLDPVSAFLARGVSLASDPAVRRALHPLADLAEHGQCVVLLIQHGTARAGLTGFLGVCQSAWRFGVDPLDPQRRVVAPLHHTLAAPPPSLAFSLVPQETGPPRLAWAGACEVKAHELRGSTPPPAKADTPRQRACEGLLALLRQGPQTSAQVWAWAQEQGFTETTLHRARRELGIRTARPWANGQPQCYWLLEGQQVPAPTSPGSTPDAIDQWLQELREKYPGPPAPDSL